MAEYVHQNLEAMLPELEEMERVGIFSKQEIKCIVKRRTMFEYKLQRRIVQEVDFLRYIQYELNLDLLRKRRKRKCGIQKQVLPGEALCVKRLHLVFQNALKKFTSDVKLWLQYIDFCKRMGSNQVITKVIGRMLQAHPNNAGLWIMAAKWEFEDKSNIQNARSLLQRALRLNPKSSDLWLEYFRLELLHIDKVKKRRKVLGLTEETKDDDEPSSAEFLSGKTASIVYNNAVENIPGDVEFHLKFVNIYNLFDGTDNGVDEIFERLSQEFPNSELYWNALAHRGFNKVKISESDLQNLSDAQRLKLETERNGVFEKAVKQLQTENMWGYYIDACLKDLCLSDSEKRVDNVLQVFQNAAEVKKLTADKYQLWVEALIQKADLPEAVKVSKAALKIFTCSIGLWLQYLKLELTDKAGFTPSLLEHFFKALKQVDCEGVLSLWNLWLEHSLFLNFPETERVFEECVASCSSHEIKSQIKEIYVEFVAMKHGIKKARKIYQRLSKERSMSISFYEMCIAVEHSQLTPSVDHLRQLYETALDQFGSVAPGLWLDYIRLQVDHGNLAEVGKLHWKAMKCLSGDGVHEFTTKYTLLQQSAAATRP